MKPDSRVIAVVGPTRAGKTSLIYQLVHGKKLTEFPITLGVDIHTDNTDNNLSFWDFVGQKRIFEVVWKYPRHYWCKLLVLTPDSTVDDLCYYLGIIGNQNTIIIINKCTEQLESQPHQKLLEKCQEMGLSYIQTDSLTGEGINQVRSTITERVSHPQTKNTDYPVV